MRNLSEEATRFKEKYHKDPEFRAEYLAYQRQYRMTHPEFRNRKLEYARTYNRRKIPIPYSERNVDLKKHYAEIIAQKECPLGPCCELCDSTEYLQRHHPDYDYPTIIVTSCASCHNFIHRGVD